MTKPPATIQVVMGLGIMRLLYTPNSPFARKARVLIRERDATAYVDEEIAQPLENPPALREANPLGKVPVLLVPGQDPIIDSPVIVEYLDCNLPGNSSLPKTGTARWRALGQQAIGDGILDAAFSIVAEKGRKDATVSAFWLDRWCVAIMSGVALLETKAAELARVPDVGSISIACALDYLDFRHPDLNWRSSAPLLTTWHEHAVARSSFLETRPGP